MLQLIAQLQRYTIYTRFRAVWDSVFKEHCKTFVFPPCIFVSVFNAHRIKREWFPLFSFSPFWLFAPLYVSSQKPNLRHIDKKAHHLASITRVIIFAVRPFAHVGRVKGKPAAFSSHCSSFLKCVAKVVLLFVSCKQNGEKVCFLNFPLLKRLFIHIF